MPIIRSQRRVAAVSLAIGAALALTVCSPATVNEPPPTPADPTPVDPTPVDPTPVDPTPPSGGTNFLTPSQYLAEYSEPDWYEQNIPFVDLPDDQKQIQDVYYYRWRVYKEHLRYTDAENGYVSTEFLDCCGYAAPFQAINAAAAHHITDGRWVRDRQYDDDEIDFWLTGVGASAKPMTEGVNPDTSDWAHEYSFWLASAAYGRAQVTGDFTQLEALLPRLKKQYDGWAVQFDSSIGLYWVAPVWDAMEYAAPGYRAVDLNRGTPYQRDDEAYHGGQSFRTTLNSYQYGDAMAIASIADRVGDTATASTYRDRAAKLKAAMTAYLWDPSTRFFYSVLRHNNPSHARIVDKEQVGYLPWMFGAADASQAPAWSLLNDSTKGFGADYGPTTLARDSTLFMKDAASCCRWDGPSWPFSTSQTLTGLVALLQGDPSQSTVSAATFATALTTYAKTQSKGGKPYVAEAHAPDTADWIYDGPRHSEDYSHSSYVDLVLSGLIGIQPQSGDSVTVNPLVPSGWDHFAAENVPYHGHNLSVVWNNGANGKDYYPGAGRGLTIWIDGTRVKSSSTLQPTTVPVKAVAAPKSTRLVNDAANPTRIGYPVPFASRTFGHDSVWGPIDGKTWYSELPELVTRWTNYTSANATDFWGLDFGTVTPVSDVRFSGYEDNDAVKPAASYRLQYLSGSTWADVPDQIRDPATPVGNALTRITFPTLLTTQLRVLFTPQQGKSVGLTEFQVWSASSRTAKVEVGPANAVGIVPINGKSTVTVTVTARGATALTGVTPSLAVADGWTSTLVSSPASTTIGVGAQATWTYDVTPPEGLTSGTKWALVGTASYSAGGTAASTHQRGLSQIGYPAGSAAPVGRWKTDEGAGTVANDSSGSHPLTLGGGATWTSSGGHAGLLFSGSGRSAESSGTVVDTAGPFTVSAWVRLDAANEWRTAVSQDGPGGSSAFYLQYSKDDKRMAFSTTAGRALADAAPVVGRWYHLVGVHDASAASYSLYVDGVRQSTVWNQMEGTPSTGALAIGRAMSGNSRGDWWNGAVSDVTVWNRALGESEISALP
jgi:hypothetical protein